MSSELNDKTSFSAANKRRPLTSGNLEFDFVKKPTSVENGLGSSPTSQSSEKPMSTLPSDVEASKRKSTLHPSPPISPAGGSTTHSEPQNKPTPAAQSQNTSKNMSNPSFSQLQQNIQRQSREQKAVGSLLSGVAIALLGGILLIAALAGFGGYILWNQIQDQKVTVGQLNDQFTSDIQIIESSLKATNDKLEAIAAQNQDLFKLHKQQITSLQNQLEEVRNQLRRDRAAEQARLKKIESRLFELEREVSKR